MTDCAWQLRNVPAVRGRTSICPHDDRLDLSAEDICEVLVAGRQVGDQTNVLTKHGDASIRSGPPSWRASVSGLGRQFEGTLKDGFGVEVVVW